MVRRDVSGEATMIRLRLSLTSRFIISLLILNLPVPSQAEIARDPGPRAGSPGAGNPLDGLTGPQRNLFNAGIAEFRKRDEVKADGLGPRMEPRQLCRLSRPSRCWWYKST